MRKITIQKLLGIGWFMAVVVVWDVGQAKAWKLAALATAYLFFLISLVLIEIFHEEGKSYKDKVNE